MAAAAPLVFVQVETTGFEPRRDQVVIVAAQHGSTSFSRKVVPSVPIKPEARELHGLSVFGGCLFYEQDPIFSNVVGRRQAWSDFLEFVAQYEAPILLGYNVRLQESFVRREIQEAGLAEKFTNSVRGGVRFADLGAIVGEVRPESSGLPLRELASRHLEMCRFEAWEMFGLPLYKLELQQALLRHLEVPHEVIHRLAVPAF